MSFRFQCCVGASIVMVALALLLDHQFASGTRMSRWLYGASVGTLVTAVVMKDEQK